jgi:hypothetical protein
MLRLLGEIGTGRVLPRLYEDRGEPDTVMTVSRSATAGAVERRDRSRATRSAEVSEMIYPNSRASALFRSPESE